MDKIEEIKKLKSLLDQGAITQDEYDLLKKNILENNGTKSISKPNKSNSHEKIPASKLKPSVDDVQKNISNDLVTNTTSPRIDFGNFKKGAIVIGIIILIIYLLSSSNSVGKKQFDNMDQLTSAFRGQRYDDVKAILGEPYFKYLDVVQKTITYRWHGVGVIGRPDAVITFGAFEYSGSFSGHNFDSVYFSEDGWDRIKGNDDVYRID